MDRNPIPLIRPGPVPGLEHFITQAAIRCLKSFGMHFKLLFGLFLFVRFPLQSGFTEVIKRCNCIPGRSILSYPDDFQPVY